MSSILTTAPPAAPDPGNTPRPPATTAAPAPSRRRRSAVFSKLRHWSVLYLLMGATVVGMVVFSYYPKIDVVLRSFYRWEPQYIEDYIGWEHYKNIFTQDPLFWQSFRLVVILLLANLVKMWPSVFAAIALHRLRSDRARYVYQVLFVVPMVIPVMVWLLIWKSFFEAEGGIVNGFLNATGLMSLLHWLDGSPAVDVATGQRVSSGGMPWLAERVSAFDQAVLQPVVGGVWGLIALGGMVAVLSPGWRSIGRRWLAWVFLLGYALWAWGGAAPPLRDSPGAVVVGSLLVPAGWLWLPMMFAVALGVVAWLRRGPALVREDRVRWVGGVLIAAGAAVVLLGKVWTEPVGGFGEGQPSWLGNSRLIVPTLILWGFPWVGTVGVLLYLAGLQQISKDVYEAAELDGVGPVGMVFRIELPLILTMFRINLIFMTIGTLTGYEMNLILFGPEGGTNNAAMVPGLYIFWQSFYESKFGYACALGMVMFTMILVLTIIYQRYVRVEK